MGLRLQRCCPLGHWTQLSNAMAVSTLEGTQIWGSVWGEGGGKWGPQRLSTDTCPWEGGDHRHTPTSSISLIHRSMPSNDQRLVMSYTRRIPCKGDTSTERPRGHTEGVLFWA